MVKLHDSLICREGDVKTCSRGRNSCPTGNYGGWTCDGHCLYNTYEDFVNGKMVDGEEHESNDQFLKRLRDMDISDG
jgi:hypothetical protein